MMIIIVRCVYEEFKVEILKLGCVGLVRYVDGVFWFWWCFELVVDLGLWGLNLCRSCCGWSGCGMVWGYFLGGWGLFSVGLGVVFFGFGFV